jgi:DNA polymerase III subunit epsilon
MCYNLNIESLLNIKKRGIEDTNKMQLNSIIDRPLVIFDLETTGTNTQADRIVEISVIKISPSGEKEIKTRKINPEMPIPQESTAIHGISDEDVKDAPTFSSISKNLYIYLEGCDLAGYNIRKFDIPVLIKEFGRASLTFSVENRRIIDSFSIFCKMEPRTLSAAYRYFCGKKLENAHSAEADTKATLGVLEGQIEMYSAQDVELPEGLEIWPKSMDELDAFCDQRDPARVDEAGRFKWRSNEVIVAFGKNNGTTLKDVAMNNPGFLKWIINADFPPDTKEIASQALVGEFPKKDA